MREDRPPPSSSALVALCLLTPPSPVLSLTQLLPTTLTSGDIPILLDLAVEVARPSLHEDDHRRSCLNLEPGVRPSSSISTVGTFGPIAMHPSRDSWISEPWSSGNRDTFGGLTGSLSGPTFDSQGSLAWEPETSDHSRFTLSTSLLSSSVDTPGMEPLSARAQAPGGDRNGGNTGFLEDKIIPLDHSVLIHKPEISRTYSSSPPHPGLCYLLDSNSLPYRSRLSVESSSSCSSSPRSLKNQSKGTGVENVGDPFGISHVPHATVDLLPGSPKGCRAISTPPWHELSRLSPSLPASLAWLDRSSIELSIDQEGFRAVQARFRFTGYSSRHSWNPYSNSPDNIAQFRPISRQIFNFHYASLEALPVLRRLGVNGDEDRDYITRQASLGLKVNGVYTVRGNEAPSLPATFTNGDPPVELCWKFEYFVDDRRVDATGKKVVDGEKILTPLTFCCSPLLLHPFQGKKITVMHIVKKSVAIKLVAEKMEPPSTPCPRKPSPAPKASGRSVPVHLLTKSSVWNVHRRTKSYIPLHTKDHGTERKASRESPPDRVLPDAAAQMVDPHARSIRRRRASSAGECDRSIASPNPMLCHAGYYPARHIVPRSRLADLLDQETENIPLPIVSPPPPVDTSGFQPLRPSPRHRQARILRS